MIVKCIDCNQPMTETKKNKPKDIPPQNKWIVCRDCNKGIELIGSDVPAQSTSSEVKEVQVIRFTETKTVYVEIENTPDGVIKKIFSDSGYTNPIGEERLN